MDSPQRWMRRTIHPNHPDSPVTIPTAQASRHFQRCITIRSRNIKNKSPKLNKWRRCRRPCIGIEKNQICLT